MSDFVGLNGLGAGRRSRHVAVDHTGRGNAVEIITNWALNSQHATPQQLLEILQCLDESYLSSLPPPPHSKPWPRNPKPANWRFLWRRQTAVILGVVW